MSKLIIKRKDIDETVIDIGMVEFSPGVDVEILLDTTNTGEILISQSRALPTEFSKNISKLNSILGLVKLNTDTLKFYIDKLKDEIDE